VRAEDFERARYELDRALLREAIFEVLPQAVLEFQNLWCVVRPLSRSCSARTQIQMSSPPTARPY
jgi:hypothetical protein